jgi:hypothetical protein
MSLGIAIKSAKSSFSQPPGLPFSRQKWGSKNRSSDAERQRCVPVLRLGRKIAQLYYII